MNKLADLLLTVLLLAAISNITVWSYPTADTLRCSLDSYVVGDNYFSRYNLLDNNKWHLGDDCGANAGTNVYAIGAGIVRHAQYHAPYWQDGTYHSNYGGMYIIEHDVNGEKVCALYVHMNFASFTKTAGQEVTKDEYLGQVGNREQNGDYPVHFHFGIRKGAYPSDPNAYIYGDWIFSGYTSEESVLNDWHNPSTFIAQHQVLPGQLSNGTFNSRIQACAQQFASLGLTPYDNGGGLYVHDWQGITLQDLIGSDGYDYAIIDNGQTAFLLKGGFRWYYLSVVNGPIILGTLLSNEYPFSDYPVDQNNQPITANGKVTWIRQDFSLGYLMWRKDWVDNEYKDFFIHRLPGVTEGGDLTITLVPPPSGPIPDLTLQAQVLTPTSIQVWGNAMGQSTTEVYLNGDYVGQLQDNTLVITGLQEQTSYDVYLRALDNQGNELDTAGPITVVTPAFPATTAPVTLTQAVSVSDWPPPVVKNPKLEARNSKQITMIQNPNFKNAVGCLTPNLFWRYNRVRI